MGDINSSSSNSSNGSGSTNSNKSRISSYNGEYTERKPKQPEVINRLLNQNDYSHNNQTLPQSQHKHYYQNEIHKGTNNVDDFDISWSSENADNLAMPKLIDIIRKCDGSIVENGSVTIIGFPFTIMNVAPRMHGESSYSSSDSDDEHSRNEMKQQFLVSVHSSAPSVSFIITSLCIDC